MMRWLISTSLRLRVSVVALTMIFMVAGLRTLRDTAFDVFPEFAPPMVEIQTEAPGLSTAEVEALITVPIENALNGSSWLKKIRSKSVLGLSSVVLYFKDVDLMQARQLVQERLLRVATELPAIAKPPVLLSPLSSMSRVMKIGITSPTLSQMEMTTIAKWTIRPRLMAIPGVANVAIWGQRDRQIQARINPQHLRDHGVTIDEVVHALQNNLAMSGGGFIDTPNQRLPVVHLSTIKSPGDLESVPVAFRAGAAITLGQVATMTEGFPPPIGDAVINDVPGLLLIVEKQPWGNTLEVTTKVENAIAILRPGLGDLQVDTTIFRPATFIQMALANLKNAMVIGCVLVIMVLVFFLNNWRAALISVLAIPTSLLTAALVFHYHGAVMNTMVLAGLIIALGEVVDDAIIDVENIARRLRLNRALPRPLPAPQVVLNASLEVRSAVVYGSIIVSLVLLPVFMLEGVSGAFFRPLATAYVLAILASLAVALTLTPALALLLLPDAADQNREGWLVRGLKALYEPLLNIALRGRHALIVMILALCVLAGFIFNRLGEEFLPNFKEYDFLMHWVEKPGTSLEAMQRITVSASRELRAIPGVRNFGSHIGRAEVADEVVGPNFTELWISLDPEVDYHATVAKIQEVVDGYPGLYRDLLTYLRERIKEVLTGSSASLVVRIYGDNLEVLREKSAVVRDAIAAIDGVADLKIQAQILVPQVEVHYRPEAAARYGLTPGDVRRQAAALLKGVKVGEFLDDQKSFDITVIGQPQLSDNFTALQELLIAAPNGASARLGDVADIIIAPTPNVITREAASRYIEVTCNVRNRDLAGVAKDIEKQLKSVPFDQGYHPELLGEYAAQKASKQRILAFSALSLIGIFLILYSDFASMRLALLVFFSLPIALVGGVFSVFGTTNVISLGSLVGFVTVLGIAARNSIMLVSHYRHLQTEENMVFGRELIVRGAMERLTPILMTALAAGLALLPLAIHGDKPGHEIEHPMAIVILGGLVTSTALNLFALPALYWMFAPRHVPPAQILELSELNRDENQVTAR